MIADNFPLVSIPIITYNHENFIANAIESVLSQDYPNIEIIISDDSSTDNTVSIIQNYVHKYPHKIKLLTSQKNMGATQNWYKAISVCSGKYIAGLAGDDYFLPKKISKQVSAMETDSDISICYTDASVFHVPTQKVLYNLSDKAPTLSGNIKTALSDCIYYSPTTMFRKNLIPKMNLFENIRSASDLAFFKEVMILSAPNGKILYLPEVLYVYNKHNDNLTVLNKQLYLEHIEAIKILQDKYPEYRKLLEPAIYDFCCVAFFKTILNFNIKQSFYYLTTGLKASHFNPFKFLRATIWGFKFYLRNLFR